MLGDNPIFFTRFDYRYRDSSNFKVNGYVFIQGILGEKDRKEIYDRMEDGEFFIAEQIDIPPLYAYLYDFSNGQTTADHCWHEFIKFSDHDGPADGNRIWGSAQEFLWRFRLVEKWDLRLSPHSEL